MQPLLFSKSRKHLCFWNCGFSQALKMFRVFLSSSASLSQILSKIKSSGSSTQTSATCYSNKNRKNKESYWTSLIGCWWLLNNSFWFLEINFCFSKHFIFYYSLIVWIVFCFLDFLNFISKMWCNLLLYWLCWFVFFSSCCHLLSCVVHTLSFLLW